jgi:hypothetical protein
MTESNRIKYLRVALVVVGLDAINGALLIEYLAVI